MNQISIPIIKLPNAFEFSLPQYAHELSTGLALQAAISTSLRVAPRERILVPTGICLAIPLGIEGQIRTNIKTAQETGLIVFDSPSSIDPSFRNEVKCLIYNASDEIIIIKRGMVIADLYFSPVIKISWQEVSSGA